MGDFNVVLGIEIMVLQYLIMKLRILISFLLSLILVKLNPVVTFFLGLIKALVMLE